MNTATHDRERADRLMAMGQMAASLAHEIRNPLGSMELFCTLLKKDLQEQPTTLNLAEQIHQGIRRLDHIISNCLQFSRDIQPRKSRHQSLRAMLDEVCTFVRAESDALGVSVEIEECTDGTALGLDTHLMSQAVSNILRNAVEAAAQGGRTPPRVSVRSAISAEGGWTLSIADNGPGIPAGDVERIFDPFFTTKQGGTGLGLAIVHSIVQVHGGCVEIKSDGANGTEVIIRVPNQTEEMA